MNEKETAFDWIFGLEWLVACAVGTAIGGMAAFVSMWSAGAAVESSGGETAGALVAGGLFGALFGLGANLGPGLLLQRKGINAVRWIIYSVIAGAIGVGVGFAFMLGSADTLSDATAALLIGLTLGLPVGIGQWLLLRSQNISANEWPLISVAAYLLAMAAGIPLGGEGREWLALTVTGLLVGAVTGLGMVWLRRQTAVST